MTVLIVGRNRRADRHITAGTGQGGSHRSRVSREGPRYRDKNRGIRGVPPLVGWHRNRPARDCSWRRKIRRAMKVSSNLSCSRQIRINGLDQIIDTIVDQVEIKVPNPRHNVRTTIFNLAKAGKIVLDEPTKLFTLSSKDRNGSRIGQQGQDHVSEPGAMPLEPNLTSIKGQEAFEKEYWSEQFHRSCRFREDNYEPRDELEAVTSPKELQAWWKKWRDNIVGKLSRLAASPRFIEYTWSLMNWADNRYLPQLPPEPKVGNGDFFYQLYVAGVTDFADTVLLRNAIDSIIAWCQQCEGEKPKGRGKSGGTVEKRSWTQPELDARIGQDIKEEYRELIKAARDGTECGDPETP